jgi:hypothetical protein
MVWRSGWRRVLKVRGGAGSSPRILLKISTLFWPEKGVRPQMIS